MQLKFPRAITKLGTGLWWQSNVFLATGYITLLFYALIWEAGNIVSLPTKRIGFYNFCLWNQEAEKLDCHTFKDLEKMGVNIVALVLSRICVYTVPVICLFVFTTVLQAFCFKDKDGWKLARTLLAISVLLLSCGVGLLTVQTGKWFQVSELGNTFVALFGAYILLLLHLIIIVLYLVQFKDTLSSSEFFLKKGLP